MNRDLFKKHLAMFENKIKKQIQKKETFDNLMEKKRKNIEYMKTAKEEKQMEKQIRDEEYKKQEEERKKKEAEQKKLREEEKKKKEINAKNKMIDELKSQKGTETYMLTYSTIF